MFTRHNQRGVSLVELVLFIVIVSIALAGIVAVLDLTTRRSADPIIRKQSLAIAESLLEEVALMPFTFCDPNDANADTAANPSVGPGNCATTVEGIGPEGETRYANPQFDNVNDYHNFAMTDGVIRDILQNDLQLSGYTANVTVAAAALGGITQASGEALLITVTVTGPDNQPIVLQGYRTRYAPTVLP